MLLPQDELKGLMETTHEACTSIFLPMEQMGPETRQNPIRFKNLLKEAEEQLIAKGLDPSEVMEMLKPAQALDNYDFWQHQSTGLGVFCAPNLFHYYRLPLRFEETVVVGERFYLKPLLPLLTGDGQFYVLALSQNQVTLLQGSRYSVSEVNLETLPESLAEVMRFDDPEKNLQFRTGIAQGGGNQAAAFHGQDADDQKEKAHLQEYFRQIDHGLHQLLREEEAPLVLAGVEYLLPLYQGVNTYAHLLPEGITGNPEPLKPEELHDQAWTIVQPHFLQAQQTAADRYHELLGAGQASNDLQEVATAAYNGRIESLFIAAGYQQWGYFDLMANVAHLHSEAEAGDEDLLNFAAIHTCLNRGTVYVVEPEKVPDQTTQAAVFRY